MRMKKRSQFDKRKLSKTKIEQKTSQNLKMHFTMNNYKK